MSQSRRAVTAACLALTVGGAGAAVLAGPAGAASQASRIQAKGAASVSLTGPKGKTHTSKHTVTCAVHNGTYTLTEHQKRSDITLRVPKYTGAGSYTGSVSIWRYGKKGLRHRHLTLPVTLTTSGGSATYSRTLTGKKDPALAGKTISASASWTCTA